MTKGGNLVSCEIIVYILNSLFAVFFVLKLSSTTLFVFKVGFKWDLGAYSWVEVESEEGWPQGPIDKAKIWARSCPEPGQLVVGGRPDCADHLWGKQGPIYRLPW